MKISEYLKDMPTFASIRDVSPAIHLDDDRLTAVIEEWAKFLTNQKQKGFINLFLTGSGVSREIVPDLIKIIKKLEDEYLKALDNKSVKRNNDVENLFKLTLDDKRQDSDRSIVARLLNVFQEKKDFKEHVWKKMNEWLFKEIYEALPTFFHNGLVAISQDLNILSLTLNFDGLLIKSMLKNNLIRFFSLPTCEECEDYYLRGHGSSDSKEEYLEIQMRGDILYVVCDSKNFCTQKGKKVPLWTFDNTPVELSTEDKQKMLLHCPSCGETRYSYLSFPGSNEKENDMRDMLSIIWKYCAFRVGTVTAVGVSGKWDPLIVAFLGDLLNEREVPLLVIEKEQEIGNAKNDSYLVNELVAPKLHNNICLHIGADNFMSAFLKQNVGKKNSDANIITNDGAVPNDEYWNKLEYPETENNTLKKIHTDILESLNLKYSNLEKTIDGAIKDEYLENFSQLGLKSRWLNENNPQNEQHNRYNHSVGVMKIATYLYDRILTNTENKIINENERQFLRLATLLHDVGHLPFSHLIENVFQELNWKPAGYSDDYSHELQTEEKIKDLFNKPNPDSPDLLLEFKKTGYYVDDLINLVHGRFGIPYLDAIINSPLDADKIDYVFRDTDLTKRKISLSQHQFLDDIYDGISISPEKFLTISGAASKAFAELLNARRFLYHDLYLQPSILILEGIVKLILKTYFVYNLDLSDTKIIDAIHDNKKDKDIPDLGEYKIQYCVRKLIEIMKLLKGKEKKNIEIDIVRSMINNIKKEIKDKLNPKFYDNLLEGWSVVDDTKSLAQLKALEKKMTVREIFTSESFDSISDTIRDVTFRIPGAAIIELRKMPNNLAISDSRKEKERSDGTKTGAECILVPDGHYKLWNSTSKATKALQDSSLKDNKKNNLCVYLYPLSGDSEDTYFIQAVNLFDKMTERKGIETKNSRN